MPAASLYYYGPSPLTAGKESTLCHAKAGNLVHTRVRLADNFVDNTTAPAGALQWEGPYLRIYPQVAGLDPKQDREYRAPSKLSKWAKDERLSVVTAAAAAGFVEPVKDSALADCNYDDDFFYEIDLIGCKPLYLPFDATIKLYTQYAGAWLVDAALTIAQEAAIPSLAVQEYYQTRRIRENTSRRIRVPTGCVSWQYAGGYAPSGTLDFDAGESAKVSAFGSNTINDFMYVAGGATFPVQQPIGANRVISVTAPVAGPVCLTFGIRL